MGVNISGKGVLSGLATLVAGVVNNLNLLVTRIIGYTNTGGGGSSYYTTIVESTDLGFVSVGPNKKASYSTDGINWTETTGPFDNFPYDMIYAQDKFVTVGQNFSAAHSLDGINWTFSEIFSQYPRSLAYGDNKFVAVSLTNFQAPYSSNGINWIPNYHPLEGLESVVYAQNKFVSISNNSSTAYSTDGLTWTVGSSLPFSDAKDMVYADNKFVVVGIGNKSAYSTDGINWTETNMPSNKDWSAITYGNGKFIATDPVIFGTLAYSTDGINWDSMVSPIPAATILTYAANKFILGSDSFQGSLNSAYSVDGISWTLSYMSNSSPRAIAYGNITRTVETQISIGDQGSGGAEILAPVDVYTVPANKTTDIDEVRVKNTSANTITYDLGVLNTGVELTDINALINDQSISAGATATITNISSPLTAGQRIVILPSAVDVVEVKVYGTES